MNLSKQSVHRTDRERDKDKSETDTRRYFRRGNSFAPETSRRGAVASGVKENRNLKYYRISSKKLSNSFLRLKETGLLYEIALFLLLETSSGEFRK